MKILILASASYRGGATFSLINTLIGLKRKGVDITVVTPEKGYLCDILSKNSISYIISPVALSIWPNFNSYKDYLLFTPRLLRTILINSYGYYRLLSIVKKFQPDIIHTNVSVINIGYLVSKRLNIPHIWHIREYGDLDFDMKHIPTRSVFINRLKKSYSIAITNDLKTHFGLDNNCRVIYNAIEDNLLKMRNANNKLDNIIFVGRLSENKGTTMLIKTFIHFLNSNKRFKLLLIGDYNHEYGNHLTSLINQNNASNYIKLLGGRTDVFEIMNKSKAIIVPSRCEGFGRITAEAMFNNCLVIGKDTGGTKEQLDNGVKLVGEEIGMRFKDDSELLERLFDLDKMSDSTYNNMIIKAKEVAIQLYNTDNNTEQTYNFINSILIKSNNPSL